MKKALSTLLLFIISSMSYADSQSFYVGGGLGQAYSFDREISENNLSEVRGGRLLTSQKIDYETQGVDQPSLSVFTGYRLSDWFALELEAFRHGKSQVEEKVDHSFRGGDTSSRSYEHELSAVGASIRGILSYMVSGCFSANLRAGLAWMRTKLESEAIPLTVEIIDNRIRGFGGAPATTERERNIKPTFGLGGSYFFNDHWSAELAWDRFLIPDGTIDRLEARVQYAF